MNDPQLKTAFDKIHAEVTKKLGCNPHLTCLIMNHTCILVKLTAYQQIPEFTEMEVKYDVVGGLSALMQEVGGLAYIAGQIVEPPVSIEDVNRIIEEVDKRIVPLLTLQVASPTKEDGSIIQRS